MSTKPIRFGNKGVVSAIDEWAASDLMIRTDAPVKPPRLAARLGAEPVIMGLRAGKSVDDEDFVWATKLRPRG
jgi:hypothetical protein